MRATTLLNQLLCLPKATVRDVEVADGRVWVGVRPQRRRMRCPYCCFTTVHRYDTRDVDSSWRGIVKLLLMALSR